MEMIFAYLAGLLTLINPCVLPVLPIVLATALQSSRWGPVSLAAGMSVTFVVIGMLVAVFGRSLGIDDVTISRVGAIAMLVFGVVLLVPRLGDMFASVMGGVASHADQGLENVDRSSLRGQLIAGGLLGLVWTPCVGPTLGGAIALASAGENLMLAGAIMVFFALGVSTIILALGYGARSVILKRQALLRSLASKARPIMGVIFVAVGLAILFNLHKMAEIWLINVLPYWLQDLSVRF